MLFREFRQAFRSLLRSPVYALVCLLTCALVVGAAAAIFGAVDAVLLRPLPYPDPGSLLFIGERSLEATGPASVAGAYTLNQVMESSRTLQDVAIFNILGGDADRVGGSGASVGRRRHCRLLQCPAPFPSSGPHLPGGR